MKNLKSNEIIVINKNEIKLDLYLNKNQMILCGTCMFLNKNNLIMGLSCVDIIIYKDCHLIKQTITNCEGHYFIKLPISNYYVVYAHKKNLYIKKIIDCNNSSFCMQHFIFK